MDILLLQGIKNRRHEWDDKLGEGMKYDVATIRNSDCIFFVELSR